VPTKGDNFDLYQAIRPKKLSEEIFEQIKSLIYQGKLKPGDRLPPERALAEHFSVGRPCLREALNQLCSIGLLEIRKKDGYFVRSLSEQIVGPLQQYLENEMSNLIDFLEVRRLIDVHCAKEAIRQATPQDIKKIQEAYARRDNIDFHTSIAESTHNLIYTHMVANMHSLLSGISFIKNYRSDNEQQFQDHHKRILEAITRRDEAEVERAINDHINSYIDFARRATDEAAKK
jgi:GntR family transcriptional repressor for pyruvate dehydrogenase complex